MHDEFILREILIHFRRQLFYFSIEKKNQEEKLWSDCPKFSQLKGLNQKCQCSNKELFLWTHCKGEIIITNIFFGIVNQSDH